MNAMQWLLRRTPGEHDPVPRIGTLGVDIGNDDSPDTAPNPAPGKNAGTRYILDPLFVMIEYTDASGAFTRRRVTTRHVVDYGTARLLTATCHERNAMRHFRLDRIGCVIDQDGEIFPTADWFAEVLQAARIDSFHPIKTAHRQAKAAELLPYTALCRAIAPALTLLVAAARSDDILHPGELDRILLFCEDEAMELIDTRQLRAMPSADDFDKLDSTIRRMRPTSEDVISAFDRLGALHFSSMKRLVQALIASSRADGRIDDIEAMLIDEFRALGARHHGHGWDE